MKICFLASAHSIHTVRWVNAMAERGHEVHLITIHPADENNIDSRVKIKKVSIPPPIGYYLGFFQSRNYINKIKPDIINAHYASGYGTLARFVNYSPYLLSVWGSDVFKFPFKNSINLNLIKKNLESADQIASTSEIMKKQTLSLCEPNMPISVTPFGVDMQKFYSRKISNENNTNIITIGTVKSMEDIYGIKLIIEGTYKLIKLLKLNNQDEIASNIRLLLVGGGSKIDEYKSLADELELSNITNFTGKVPYDMVPEYLNKLDIYVAPSISESFGVAIVEASACELPVVVSDVGGLPEVVQDGKTGFIVEKNNSTQIAEKLYQLIMDKNKRELFGKQGREFVLNNYDWDKSVDIMEELYRSLLRKGNN
ncbi:glycosyltransferase [Caldalkalibacillus salinus]|uniref:glycosyltransferase n=1 Tax=Caldalkalibacillus salinus TaxID=2803787 RepID=UPI002351B0A2|nr:glycosyltransferase [Caldalkalibacillus salinus]